MANHMAEVARILGVELGEEFELIFPQPSSCHATVKFTNDGLSVVSTNVYDVYNFKAYLLEHLLKGIYTIKRKPWQPAYNERYYSIGPGGTLEPGIWMNDFIDIALYRFGNCYRTHQEAEANSGKWIAFYASDEVLEV